MRVFVCKCFTIYDGWDDILFPGDISQALFPLFHDNLWRSCYAFVRRTEPDVSEDGDTCADAGFLCDNI